MNRKTTGRLGRFAFVLLHRTGVICLCAMLVLLSACASKGSTDSGGKSDKRRAAESNTSLGLEYMNRGQDEVALGKLKKAASDDPTYAPAHTVMAVLYERLGEMNLAGKHYKKAYEIDPTNGDVNNNYGIYLCQTGDRKKAMAHFQTALEDPFYSSPAVALTNAGSCAMQMDDYVTADELLRRALKIEPDLPDALISMSNLNYLEGNYMKSRAFLQRYEAVADHRAESLLLAYKVEAASDDPRAANKYKILLEANFPDTKQTDEVRRLSRQ